MQLDNNHHDYNHPSSRPHYSNNASTSMSASTSSANMGNPPQLQSPYHQTRQQQPNSPFHVRDLEQSLDEASSPSSRARIQPSSSYTNSSSPQPPPHMNGGGRFPPPHVNGSGNGRESPSRNPAMISANRMHNASSPSHGLPNGVNHYQTSAGSTSAGSSGSGSISAASSSGRRSSDATATPNANANNANAQPTPTPTSTAQQARSRNPLIDLIDTEKGYVEDLGLVIKKVAAAWSRSNFPPPALDKMFRAVEAVYRIDKQFLAKLNDIGPNPSSPKALGDLLMRWIDDLEPAYTKYVNAYQGDFDNYPPVQNNPNLQPILQSLPQLSSSSFDLEYPTLDALFSLPLERLQYFKKLYGKLLKSTQPGKSDHNLLVGANEKLDWLLDMSRQSGTRRVTESPSTGTEVGSGPSASLSASNVTAAAAGPAGMDSGRNSDDAQRQRRPSQSQVQQPPQTPQSSHTALSQQVTPASSSHSTAKGHLPHLSSAHSSTSSKASIHPLTTNLSRPSSDGNVSAVSAMSAERSSGQTTASNASTALTSESTGQGVNMLVDLEKRLDTSRTLDIFTMKPKKCKLQMNPPNLPYQRSIRLVGDVQVSFVPASSLSQQEVFTPSAVIYLLTDLFLLCERIPSSNKDPRSNPYAEFWLMYPPLATKHLRASQSTDPSASETAFEIDIMRKERMTVFAESREKRDEWLEAFQEAINFAGGAGALRVNTDVSRSISPFTAASMSAGGRSTPNSMQNGPSPNSGNSNLTSLPPLPPSASTSHFPSASPSPHSSRAPTPQDPQGLPMHQRPLPPLQTQGLQAQRVQSPESISPLPPRAQQQQYQAGHPQQSPLPPPPRNQASLPFPPTQQQQGNRPMSSQSPPMRALPSPMQQSFSQPSLSRPMQNMQEGPSQQGQYRNHPQHDSYPLSHQQQQQYGQYNENLPPGHHGNMPPPAPHSEGLHKAPSMRSMGSLSSRSSGPGSSTTPSPIPPLPMKEQYPQHDWQAAQAANRRMEYGMQQGMGEYGMQPDMRQGGLLSPSRSQAGMTSPSSNGMIHRSKSAEGLRADHYRMPSAVLKDSMRGQSMPTQTGARSLPASRMNSSYVNEHELDISPPTSPQLEGPVTNQLAAQMKCKVFVQSAKNQWKSLGTAKLKLYLQSPGNRKQLVVEDKTVLISTIVLEDGVERVGKTGVAIELSDNGQRTGLIYMLQLKTEASATGLFQQLLLGSSRASAMVLK